MSNSLISHSFIISDIAARGVPVSSPVFNELDFHGSLLGLQRLPEERNADYKTRLVDVGVHRANASYIGLINGITRELGLEFFKPILITLKPGVDLAWSPRIEFKDGIVYLWKDTFTKTLDISIDIGDPGRSEYFLGGLVTAINLSEVFNAEIQDNAFAFKRSGTIINQTSSLPVGQQLKPSRVNYLGNTNIDKGSVVFNDSATYKILVDNIGLVNSSGKYFIDYQAGLITSFDFPQNASRIEYSFRQTNFIPRASPVIIRAIYSEEFQNVLFNQIEHPDGSNTSSIPTAKGALIINELLSVVPTFWGS